MMKRKETALRFHPLNEEHRYAVLVPVLKTGDGPLLLLEKRSSSLKRQPGDLCFPGGRLRPEEAPEEGAIRETKEELLVNDRQLGALKPLPIQIGPDGGAVFPFTCELKDYRFSFSTTEVERVLTIPVADLLRTPPERHGASLVIKPDPDFPFELVAGGENRVFSEKRITWLFYRHTKGTIWGLTARILEDFLEESV